MLQQLARLMLAVAVWGFSAGIAQAVSLGKIEVTSGLGEPFYAEVPLMVDADENLSSVQVDIASGDDYRILEIYRDQALNAIQVSVTSDSRGTRVELSSRGPIDAPFFNLVLKVHYSRATQFKKFPIFLDLPKAARAPAVAKPLPMVKPVEGMAPAAAVAPTAEVPAVTAATAQPAGFQPFDGWARIGRYGPMVYGDTITTVADRLRTDDRFTRQQVMVALFEKNRQKFDQDNINLIKAGTYLDVPSAAEVSRISPTEAHQVIAEHEKRWKELTQQPRYAAVAEAQRTRYSKRIRIGEQAAGSAVAPMAGEAGEPQPMAGESMAPTTAAAASAATAASTAEAEQAKAQVEQLTQQNQELQAKLAESDKKIEELAGKTNEAASAAQEQARKKLELQVARLQSELDKARDQAKTGQAPGAGWLTWLLGGLVVVLLGAVAFLLRREPKHPAMMGDEPVPSSSFDRSSVAAESSVEEEEVPEIEVEEADIEAAASGIDFGDSTMRISPEQAGEYTNSIPDLTDEDTSEMEAFQEEVEEEPDPNVDYLSEADVYLRYGMEDEALQQAHMALKQNQFNPEAHVKLAQIQRQKGDEEAFEATITSASSILTGDALATFNDAVSEMKAGETDATSLEDTMPPTEAAEMIGEDADRSAGEGGIDLESTLSELDNIDFGEMGGAEAETETIVEEAPVPEAPEASAASEDLSFDLSDFDVGGEEESVESEAEIAKEPGTTSGGGLDFDLSDVEMPASAKPAAEDLPPEVLTADLDKTVAIDWSQDTSVDSGEEMLISGESGAGDMFEEESFGEAPTEDAGLAETTESPEMEEPAGIADLDFDLDTLEEEAAEVEPEEAGIETPTVTEGPDDGVTTLDLDAGDLDAGVDLSEIEVEAADDFTSTIRTSLDDVAESDIDFTATGEHDLHLTEGAANGEIPQDSGDSLLDLDFGAEDADATQQLEDLLSEFSDEEKKDSDEDKDK